MQHLLESVLHNHYPVADNPVDNFMAESVNIIPTSCFFLWMISSLFFRRYMRFWGHMATGSILAIASSVVLKGTATYGCDSYHLTLCARPNGYDNYGMPSGHTQMAVFVTSFLALIHPDELTHVFAATFSAYMAYTRIYVFHMHTPLQVLAGGLVGYTQALITARYYVSASKA
jgi:hypothetical protein